ncbi:uncharacterized protein CLUP02_01540 [Colletotrichum lupini]|uniref:Uncharacterized protein n=1 Tax=Colletotrichum lupini TaxID=145971 RepID=A0A9Q8W8S4_9PEZI|nr:uncharacterized protein CLUP02_01540 [Colletotrichum lupini]UQC74888.1 hypothetical protein CLUP02_01540 [Colletotrichum lupini]
MLFSDSLSPNHPPETERDPPIPAVHKCITQIQGTSPFSLFTPSRSSLLPPPSLVPTFHGCRVRSNPQVSLLTLGQGSVYMLKTTAS